VASLAPTMLVTRAAPKDRSIPLVHASSMEKLAPRPRPQTPLTKGTSWSQAAFSRSVDPRERSSWVVAPHPRTSLGIFLNEYTFPFRICCLVLRGGQSGPHHHIESSNAPQCSVLRPRQPPHRHMEGPGPGSGQRAPTHPSGHPRALHSSTRTLLTSSRSLPSLGKLVPPLYWSPLPSTPSHFCGTLEHLPRRGWELENLQRGLKGNTPPACTRGGGVGRCLNS